MHQAKRKRGMLHSGAHDPVEGALILSGDAAQVDYEETTPVWKQEVTDDRGRKRLHGAFTGGFSAGYYNTVGSKEGWTPTSFVSSRTSRHQAKVLTAMDFMDEEDLADIVDDRELQSRNQDAGIQQTESLQKRQESSPPRQLTEKEETEDERHSVAKKLALFAKSQAAKRASARQISLLDDEDDVDGYDIGPQIKYDHSLEKKKKKLASGSALQHTFQSKKRMRNPEPEIEVVRKPSSPEYHANSGPIHTLLPSIGDGSHVDSALRSASRLPSKGTSADTGEASKGVNHTSQETVSTSNEIVPPWRRQPAPKVEVASAGRDTALLALESSFTPYTNDLSKHTRYRTYLEIEAERRPGPHVQGELEPDVWHAECEEFKKCAMMYKPMTGAMSQKFTSSTVTGTEPNTTSETSTIRGPLLSQAAQAAKDDKFGHLTRSIEPWQPNKLLCKRFNVAFSNETNDSRKSGTFKESAEMRGSVINKTALDALMKEA